MFGVRGETLVPTEITQKLELDPTEAWAKGDHAQSSTRVFAHPYGVWRFHSASHVDSSLLGPHVAFILDQLEPRAEVVRELLADPALGVLVFVSVDLSFTLDSSTLRRLASICEKLNVSIYPLEDDENEEDEERYGTVPPEN